MNRCVGILATGIAGVALAVVPSTEEASDRGVTYVMGGGGLAGYGCGFADLDADGDPDIVIVIVGAADGRVGIYENDGTGHFADHSLTSGVPLLTNASALALADYDDDGLVDLYLTQWSAPNVLMHNEGGFFFTDVSAFAGVNDNGLSKGACWGDYDGDRWLDLYVCNYAGPTPNRLYRNVGNGTFQSVEGTQGVNDPHLGFQAVWSDYDRDGDVDLYLSNDKGYQKIWGPNQLWRNDAGTLANASSGSGADIALDSMGLACGDFDGNRWPDFYLTNVPGGGGMNNPLLLNQDGKLFGENGLSWGVDNPWVSWGTIFYDFDNNGFLDLYVNNTIDPNTLYLNSGAPTCLEVGAGAAVAGPSSNSYSSAVADVDGDGDLDLLLNNLEDPVALYINHEGDLRGSIRYRVVGVTRNSGAVGACVDTRIGTSWKMRELLAGGNSYLGQNELLVHVGAGSATTADEVVVSWPGGAPTRTLTNLPTDATWTLYPPARLGDADDDGDVDLDDFHAFAACHGLPFAPGCEIMDLDGDADVDDDDFDAFLLIYGLPLADCNDNGTVDLEEILIDPGLDVNGDGVIDACCPADLNLDGDVGFGDILAVIGAWGPCAACPEDLDGSGDVGFGDILAVIGAWGPCG
ncbi:MAG: CRTAC1 family protein [Planctomycetes bacterium]|nr:CRTAC1 family protein [Planctomycetota bacterium]